MKLAAESIIENFLTLTHFLTYLVNPFVNFNYVNLQPTQKYPIVLVERWFTRNPFHIFAKQYLEHKGFVVYSLNYSLVKGGFEKAGQHLSEFIEKRKLKDVVLVGISGGAVTCIEYLERKNGWKNTHLFISIFGPLQGSPSAHLFPFLHSIRQLKPESTYIQALYKDGLSLPEKMVTVQAVHDSMVPNKYSKLPGVKNILLNVYGHNLAHTFYIPTYRLITNLASN